MPDKSQDNCHIGMILTFNEVSFRQLKLAIDSIKKLLSDKGARVSFVVADNPSWPVSEVDLAADWPDTYFIPGEKRGPGTAYIRGFLYADKVLKTDHLVMLDIDGGYSREEINRLVKKSLGSGQPVIGTRKMTTENERLPKKLLNLLMHWQTRWCGIDEELTGPVALPARAVESFDLTSMPDGKWEWLWALARKLDMAGTPAGAWRLKQGGGSGKKSSYALIGQGWALIRQMRPGRDRLLNQKVRLVLGLIAGAAVGSIGIWLITGLTGWAGLAAALSAMLLFQGIFTLGWMVYAWQNEQVMDQWRSPKTYLRPKHTFTAIVPARHEEKVIAQTVRAVAKLNYPQNMCEIIVVCRSDDQGTIRQAKAARELLPGYNIKVLEFTDGPINKPRGLNVALKEARGDIVAIFDAEDQPGRDIYQVVNTMMLKGNVDVVQSGVQLMNYADRWWSALNVLEYYFWFKSGLPFLSRMAQVIPLGGNTVFFRREWLKMIDGWDDKCLTEDADVGIRLARLGVRLAVTYDEKHVTQEETPLTISDFIRQRSRWDQGFLQIFAKGDWRRLPSMKQRLLAGYILLWPFAQAALALYVPVALGVGFWLKLPVGWSLFSLMPLYMLLMQMAAQMLAFDEFIRRYYRKISGKYLLVVMVTYLPYQLLLGYAAVRSLIRFMKGQTGWEKTAHVNAHRIEAQVPAGEESERVYV